MIGVVRRCAAKQARLVIEYADHGQAEGNGPSRCDYAAAPVVLVDEAPKDIPAYVSLRPLREGPP